MATKHGKNGRVSYNAAFLKVTEWDGDETVEAVDITNTESGGYQEMDPNGGIKAMNGSFTAIAVVGTAAPTAGSASLYDLILYEGSALSTEAFAFKATISSVKRSNKVKGSDPITYVCQYHSSGVIGRYTATVPA